MFNKRGMKRSDILLMVGSGNISILAMRRTSLMIKVTYIILKINHGEPNLTSQEYSRYASGSIVI
jgi:hypothetical protein